MGSLSPWVLPPLGDRCLPQLIRSAFRVPVRSLAPSLGVRLEGKFAFPYSLGAGSRVLPSDFKGAGYNVIPAECCRQARAGFRRAETRWLDDCGHFPQLEHPTVVNEWLGAFVAERPAPR